MPKLFRVDLEQQVFDYIVEHKQHHDGLSPTIRMMAKEFNTSTSVINDRLKKLQEGGKIKMLGYGKSRGIMVVGGLWNPPI